jgi:hypothetical protein
MKNKLNKKSDFYIDKKNAEIMKWLSLSDQEIGIIPKHILKWASKNIENLSKEDLLLIGYNCGNFQYMIRHIKSIVLLRNIPSDLKGEDSKRKEELYAFINFWCRFNNLLSDTISSLRIDFDELSDLNKFEIMKKIPNGLIANNKPFEEIEFLKWEDYFE